MNGSDAFFAGYRLEQRISTDTVSTTYRAVSLSRSLQRRPVALRITEPLDTGDDQRAAGRWGSDSDTVEAFFAALRGAAAVGHPALATIHDAGVAAGRLYVATELVAGATLEEHLRHHGPLPAPDAVALLRPIAEALDRVHAAGVVHGAISPRTISVPRRGADPRAVAAMLTGFGLDTLLARRVRVDRNGVDIADVCYVAPEQLGGGHTDARVDQYALACALYHCVSGRPPFLRDTVAATFGAHLFSETHVPAGRGGHGALGAAVAVGMAKRPADRHRSCVALLRAAAPPTLPRAARSTPPLVRRGAPAPAPPPALRDAAMRGAATSAPRPPSGTRRHRRRARRRLRPRRLPIPWPIAAMLVLAGIICTLLVAAVLEGGSPIDVGGAPPVGRHEPAGAVLPGTAAAGAPGRGLDWQRQLDDGAVTRLVASAGGLVAATGRTAFALEPGSGTVRWSNRAGAGELSGVAVTGQVVALRSTRLRGLSLRDGAQRWEDIDVLTPVAALTASEGVLYGVRRGQIAAELVALDARSGRRMWRYDGGAAGLGRNPVVGAAGDHVAVLSDGHLSVFDTGPGAVAQRGGLRVARWHTDVARPWPRALVVLSDLVVVASRDGSVCAYAAIDGAERWCADIVGLEERAPTIATSGTTVAVIMPFHVTALERGSGAQRWISDASHALLPLAAGRGGDVVVADATGTVRGLDAERGDERWRGSGFGEITALTAGTDAVYAGTRDGRVTRVVPGAGRGGDTAAQS